MFQIFSLRFPLADDKGLSAGQEFTIAIREARTCGAKLLLGDRDVQVCARLTVVRFGCLFARSMFRCY